MPKSKDYSISCARFVAMCFIILCHIMQRDSFATEIKGAHIEWAFWFNVGVQMFLFISGFLYGDRDEIDTVGFYKKNFPKILIDYYIFVIVMLAIIHWSPLMSIERKKVWKLLTFSGTVPGLGHLWFVQTIVFLYLFTPIFFEIIKTIDKRGNIGFAVESALLLLLIHEVTKTFFTLFTPAWINCFVVGMIYGKLGKRTNNRRALEIIVFMLCLLIIPIQFRFDYYPHEEFSDCFGGFYKQLTQYGHMLLGIVLVILIRFLYCKIAKNKSCFLLDWSDKYSYDIYLVHHIFIQSAFACVEFINNRWIALPLAVLLTVIFAVALRYVSIFVMSFCAVGKRFHNGNLMEELL